MSRAGDNSSMQIGRHYLPYSYKDATPRRVCARSSSKYRSVFRKSAEIIGPSSYFRDSETMMVHKKVPILAWERHFNTRARSSHSLHSGVHDGFQTPIAIIGMSRGRATSSEKLWKLCVHDRSAWSKSPQDKLIPESFYHPLAERQTSISGY